MRDFALAFIRWFVFFLLIWLLLSNAQGWGFGIFTAAAAALLACRLPLRWPALRLTRLPAFLGFFFAQLLFSGWDVARRALHPSLPVSPAWVKYPMVSKNPNVHLMLSALVGLLPGTLASHYHRQNLYLHTLTRHQNWRVAVVKLEQLLEQLLVEPKA